MRSGTLIRIGRENRFVMLSLTLLCLSIGCPPILFGQVSSSAVEDDASHHSHLLRWEFVPDEVMRVKTLFDYKTETNKSQSTESIYEYSWKVEDVDRDGAATLVLQFDRIRIRYRENDSVVEFDSAKPGSESLKYDPPAIGILVDKSREMLQSEYRIGVTARGEVKDIARSSSDSKPAPRLFTPAVWPILPATRASEGDAWSKQSETNASGQYRLAKVEEVVDRVLHHIVSDGEVAVFDAEAGKFIDQAKKSSYQFKTPAGERVKQSVSTRHRLFASESSDVIGSFPVAQVSKPTDTWNYLQLSYRYVREMEENLLGERNAAAGIINRLFSHIISSDDLAEPSGDWAADRWLLAAQVYEREGQGEKAKSALHNAALRAKSIGYEFNRATVLVKIANGLARLGDFPAAIEAATAIERSAAVEGVHITEQGPVEISEGALQSYALLLIVAKQAEAADVEQSLATAERIPERNAKSAAQWLIAMRQSEQGDLPGALETTELAEKSGALTRQFQQETPPCVLEVITTGPRAAQLIAFRTLALSRIAGKQALDGDDDGAVKSLKKLGIPILRNAATIELIYLLTEHGKKDSADAWVNKISDPAFRFLSRYNQAFYHLQIGDFDKVTELTLLIDDAALAVKLRLELADRLADEGETQKFDEQIRLAQQLVSSIVAPIQKAEAMHQLALRQIDIGHREAAIKNLHGSRMLIDDSELDEMGRAEALGDIAVALNSVGEQQQAGKMIESLLDDSGQMDELYRGHVILTVIDKQMQMGMEQLAQTQARSIADASQRCQAMASLGRRYGEMLELEKSRELFAAAFESAQQIDDLLGLDTPHSKGGATRLTAREQASCDRDGLLKYLEESDNPNVKVYGYLGAAESLALEAMQRAEARGFEFPNGLLQELWTPRLISKIVSPN